MLTVWGRASSSNVQKVMWAVAELSLPHERKDVGGHFGGLDTDDYGKLNPNRLVPTVEFEDGLVMFESNAIVRTLARRDAARRLWPAEPKAEALTDMWAEWSQLNVTAAITALFWAVVRTAPSQRDAALIAHHMDAATKGLAIADARLAQMPYLAGDDLTIADINFANGLYRYHTMEIDRPALPNVKRYYDSLVARPAYAEHVMVDYAALRVHD
ncbi:MAG: glutathione S-transferase [Acuticoccus sp.]